MKFDGPRSIPMTGPLTFSSPESFDWYLTKDDAKGERMEAAVERGKADVARGS